MRRHATAVTLIELLVAVSVVAILVGVLLPTLSAVRRSAVKATSLFRLSQNAAVFAAYSGDWQDRWPYFTLPGLESTTLYGAGTVATHVSFFDAHWTWHVAIADQYLGGSIVGSEVAFPPGYDRDGPYWPLRTGYLYPCVFIADPEYWRPETRAGLSQFGSTSVSDVRFPADKSLLVDQWSNFSSPSHGLGRLLCATADGGAGLVGPQLLRGGMSSGDGDEYAHLGAVHFRDSPQLLHAVDGVRGRDLAR